MSYAIIGFGKIGQALAKAFARPGFAYIRDGNPSGGVVRLGRSAFGLDQFGQDSTSNVEVTVELSFP
jgi:hypothetical protein